MTDEVAQLKNTIRFLEMDKEAYETIITKMHNGHGIFEMNSQKSFDEIIKEELSKI